MLTTHHTLRIILVVGLLLTAGCSGIAPPADTPIDAPTATSSPPPTDTPTATPSPTPVPDIFQPADTVPIYLRNELDTPVNATVRLVRDDGYVVVNRTQTIGANNSTRLPSVDSDYEYELFVRQGGRSLHRNLTFDQAISTRSVEFHEDQIRLSGTVKG